MENSYEKKMSMEKLLTANRRLLIFAIVVLISFFLTWVVRRGYIGITYTGMSLISPFISRASGFPLGLVILAPISALVILVRHIPKFLGKVETPKQLPRNQTIIQNGLIIAGLLSLTLVPFEIKTWGGGGLSTGYGYWLAVVAEIGMLFYAIQGSKRA